jgi:hypothetical protein
MSTPENPTPRTSPEDAAFDRLTAADPAAGVEPDLDALRARMPDAPGGPTATELPAASAASGTSTTSQAPTDLTAERARRRPARWLQVAAASAGVVAVGLGGFALGQQDDAPPPAAQGETPASTAEALPGTGGPAGASTMESATADRTMLPWGGRTVFESVGLPDDAGTAKAWGFDPTSTFTEETAAALAAALGVTGVPEMVDGTWHVGPQDYTGSFVQLSPDGPSSFYFTNSALDPWREGVDPASAPGADSAIATLQALMTQLGADPADFEMEVPDYGTEDAATYVVAHRLVDGRRTGLTWDATITSEGLYSVSGQLAPVVDLGDYGVVGARTAVDRLMDPRFGGMNGDVIAYRADAAPEMLDPALEPGVSEVEPFSEEDGASASTLPAPVDPTDPSAVPTLPPAPTPGLTVRWPVSTVTITGATLTSLVTTQADGATLLVPAYDLTADDGSAWTVLAVTEDHLDMSPM